MDKAQLRNRTLCNLNFTFGKDTGLYERWIRTVPIVNI